MLSLKDIQVLVFKEFYCIAYCGITKKDMEISKKTFPYVRVLGFNEKGKILLSKIAKANPKLHIVTSVKKFEDSCKNKNLRLILSKDVYATNVFTLEYEFNSQGNLDYINGILKV